ncbi:MAG TPA: alpha/beta fold hydrolase [Myxococcaceae bacterium]|nr:alpha/beta fold hydrolase [Myxococcaceae bacterium]
MGEPNLTRVEEHFEHGGQMLHYVRSGEGPPVILLHNGGTSHAIWDALTPQIAGHECFAFDLLGFGDSSKPGRGYELSAHVERLRAFIDAKGLAPVHLMGNCMGSAISLRFAMECPRDVRSLVLFNTLTPATFKRGLFGHFTPLPTRAPGVIRLMSGLALGRGLGRIGVRTQLGRHGKARGVDRRPELREAYASADQSRSLLAVLGDLQSYGVLDTFTPPQDFPPIFTLWGEENRILPVREGRTFVEGLAPVRQEWLEGCGHLPMLERPEEVAMMINAFLSSPEVAGSRT